MTKELVKVSGNEMTTVEYFSDDVIDQFIASRHASENTARTYRNAIRQMLKFFAAHDVAQPSVSDVDSFVTTVKATKAKATCRLYTAACKLFFAFTSERGIYPDVAKSVKVTLTKEKAHSKRALTAEQAQKLLASVTGDDVLAVRNKAILALALTCGLRTVEISRANVGDFRADVSGTAFLKVRGKGGKVEDVRVPAPVFTLVKKYLSLRGGELDAESPMFLSASRNVNWEKNSYGARLSEQSVQKLIRRHMKAADCYVRHVVTPHSTRHTASTLAIKSGVDLREVSAMLRHSSIETTMRYLHDISLETRRAEMTVANVLFGVNAA